MGEKIDIADEDLVSQYGVRRNGVPEFWDHPRPQDFDGLSVLLGAMAPSEARKLVRRPGGPTAADGVRYARVGDLRRHGFIVEHTPSRGNSRHVSVSRPGVWDDRTRGKFDECFDMPMWHKMSEGCLE